MSHFPCKIYNTDEKEYQNRTGDKPAYAILSMTDDFGLQEAITKVTTNSPNNLFIIINGQQSLNLRSIDKFDEHFGKALCGVDRWGEKSDGTGIWKGKYKIFTSENDNMSVASKLYDDYGKQGKNDLIIDVINAKYEYNELKQGNTKAFNDFCDNLEQILDHIPAQSINVFIAGFSRGGMFSLRLAEWFTDKRNESKEIIVVTIDPVQKYLKERKDWIKNWADWKVIESKWKLSTDNNRPFGAFRFKFPILKATGAIHYNVFQRWGGKGSSYLDQPQGSAVDGAVAPSANLTRKYLDGKNYKGLKPYEKRPSYSPYDQLDVVCTDHTKMPKKYRDWAIDIAHKHFPSFSLNTTHGYANSCVIISFADFYSSNDINSITVEIDGSNVSLNRNEDERSVSFNIPENLGCGKIEILITINEVTVMRDFQITHQSFKLNKTSDYPGEQIEISFEPARKETTSPIVMMGEERLQLLWNGNTAGFFIPKDFKSGNTNIKVEFSDSENTSETFFVLTPTIKLNPSKANRNAKVNIAFEPKPKDTSLISAIFNEKKIELNWDKQNNNTAFFTVSKTAKLGYANISASFLNRTFTENFIVTPFIMQCDFKYVQHGTEVVIKGVFHKSDIVVIGNTKIKTEFRNDSLVFKIPDKIKTGENSIYILSDKIYRSNTVQLVICKQLDIHAVCVPDRIKHNSPTIVNLISEKIKPTDMVLLDNKIVPYQKFSKKNGTLNAKIIGGKKSIRILKIEENDYYNNLYYLKDSFYNIEFTAECLAGQKDIRILRIKNDVYYLSDPFTLFSCDLIGNTNSMELHKLDCTWIDKIHASHKALICSTFDEPKENGYDNCHWCIGGSRR